MNLFRRERYPFEVTVLLDGRHPYREPGFQDFPTRVIVYQVMARSFGDAAKQYFAQRPSNLGQWWKMRLLSVADPDFPPLAAVGGLTPSGRAALENGR